MTSIVSVPSAPAQPARRFRPLGISSGAVLFVAMFLPAYRSCGTPTTPLDVWPITPPYVLGLVAAIALAVVDRPSFRVWGMITRGLATVVVLGAAVLVHAAAFDGPLVVTLPLVVLWWIAGVLFLASFRDAPLQARVSRTVAVAMLCAVAFFAIVMFDDSSMWGVAVALAASCGLGAAAVFWEIHVRREHARRAAREPPLARML